MGVGQLSESDAVDALRLPFYSSSHPTGSHGWRNQFDLGNPDLLLFRVLLEHETGESTHGEVYLDRLLEAMGQAGPHQSIASARTSVAIAAIARITGVPDRLEIAEAAA